MKEAKEICPTKTKGKIKEGALIVDVREAYEVAELAFDVPNSINIPFSEFETRFKEIPSDKEIVMVCRDGGRSLKTTYFLMNQAYPTVYNLRDGIIKWVKKGFPTIGDIKSVTDEPVGSGCCGSKHKSSSTSCC